MADQNICIFAVSKFSLKCQTGIHHAQPFLLNFNKYHSNIEQDIN